MEAAVTNNADAMLSNTYQIQSPYFDPDVEPGLLTDLKRDPLGVMGLLDCPKELPLDPRPGVPILLHSLCAAGVRPPADTRGLLGNLGTGVLSTLPVSPFLVDSFFDCDILSTIRSCKLSLSRCSCRRKGFGVASPGPKLMMGAGSIDSSSSSSSSTNA